MKPFRLAALLLSLATLSFATSAQAEDQIFNNPKVGSQPLDLCLNWGADCGKPAADAWCVSQGFEQSADHAVAYDIGASTPTRLISTGAVCDQAYCDGISQVTCYRTDPVEQVYQKPKINGKRLDLCINWGVDCGAPAAKAFCQAEGWATATDYVVAENIGANSPTRLIGTGALCDQDFCDGFKSITCAN